MLFYQIFVRSNKLRVLFLDNINLLSRTPIFLRSGIHSPSVPTGDMNISSCGQSTSPNRSSNLGYLKENFPGSTHSIQERQCPNMISLSLAMLKKSQQGLNLVLRTRTFGLSVFALEMCFSQRSFMLFLGRKGETNSFSRASTRMKMVYWLYPARGTMEQKIAHRTDHMFRH